MPIWFSIQFAAEGKCKVLGAEHNSPDLEAWSLSASGYPKVRGYRLRYICNDDLARITSAIVRPRRFCRRMR